MKNKMIKEVKIKDRIIKYELTYKKVKNINLRITCEGDVFVSASKRVSQKTIEDFILSKGEFVIKAIDKCAQRKNAEKYQYFSENELRAIVIDLCKNIYPYFKKRGVEYPVIKFKKMVSQWGNCRTLDGILTFNLNLMYAPIECIEYVVVHEFTHYLQANHSKLFYDELGKVMPDWKIRREKLKEISIR